LLLLAPQNHFPQFKFYLTYFSPPINDREWEKVHWNGFPTSLKCWHHFP
jgi:hypothetical protein